MSVSAPGVPHRGPSGPLPSGPLSSGPLSSGPLSSGPLSSGPLSSGPLPRPGVPAGRWTLLWAAAVVAGGLVLALLGPVPDPPPGAGPLRPESVLAVVTAGLPAGAGDVRVDALTGSQRSGRWTFVGLLSWRGPDGRLAARRFDLPSGAVPGLLPAVVDPATHATGLPVPELSRLLAGLRVPAGDGLVLDQAARPALRLTGPGG